jgi:hypothetical protein
VRDEHLADLRRITAGAGHEPVVPGAIVEQDQRSDRLGTLQVVEGRADIAHVDLDVRNDGVPSVSTMWRAPAASATRS